MENIKIFDYIEELDAFLPTKEYKEIADYLGLSEWNPVVWIGRLFTLDNDYGEHWFDNWESREDIKEKAIELGYEYSDLLIIDADRFKNDEDGPCNSSVFRKRFWTEVLIRLEFSKEFLFEKARINNKRDIELAREHPDDKDYQDYIKNIEGRIKEVSYKY